MTLLGVTVHCILMTLLGVTVHCILMTLLGVTVHCILMTLLGVTVHCILMTLLGVSTFVTFCFYLLFYVRLSYDFLQDAKLLARKADRTASQQTSNYRLLLFSRYCALGLLGSRV